jgi:hypothetical protein
MAGLPDRARRAPLARCIRQFHFLAACGKVALHVKQQEALMAILVAVFFLVALVCFILQTFNIPSPPPINVLALGLFFLTLAFAIQMVKV